MHSIKMVLSDLLFLAFPASFPAFLLCARDTALQLPPAPPSLAAGTAEEAVSVQVSLPGSSLAQGIETGFQFRSNQSINQSRFSNSQLRIQILRIQNSKFKIQKFEIQISAFDTARVSRAAARSLTRPPSTRSARRCGLAAASASPSLSVSCERTVPCTGCLAARQDRRVFSFSQLLSQERANQPISQSVSQSVAQEPVRQATAGLPDPPSSTPCSPPACLLRGRWRGRWMEGCAIASGARTPLMMRVNPWLSFFVCSSFSRDPRFTHGPFSLPPPA